MANEYRTITIEDAEIIFKNFSGKEGQYNVEGNRNFAVIIPEDLAKSLLADDWNVKYLKEDEDGNPGPAYLPVTVGYKIRPPRVTMITSTSRVALDEDSIGTLDWAYFKNVDLIVRGRPWDVNGKTGIKGYLQTMFVTIEEDELERKYALQDGDYTQEG